MYSIKTEKDDKYFILSKNKGFFSRYCDNGFKTKWTGLWKNSTKFLEYFAVKGLEEEKCVKTEYDYVKAVHFYGNSTETVFIPNNKAGLYVKIEFGKEIETELELALNIRKRDENLTKRKYKVKINKKKNSLKISNSLGEIEFVLLKGKMDFEERAEEKIHFPSGEKQNCFIPGKISLKGKEIIFGLIPEPKKEKKLNLVGIERELKKEEKQNKEKRTLISCNLKEIEKGFLDSAKGIELLENQGNFFAGYPWFLQYWGRDNLWSLSALISLGEFEKAKKVLEYFWGKNKKGKIPNFIEEKKIHFNSLDASLLFLNGLNNYVFASGNKKILKKINYRKILGFLENREQNGLLYHEINETWMDSIQRKGTGIEIQALYLKAMHSARNLLALEGKEKEVHLIEKKAVELNSKILNEFRFNGVYKDSVEDATKTCNPLVYLMQKKAEEKEIQLFESEEFNGIKGILTRGRKEQGFDSNGYHTGLVWSLVTGWMACAEFKAERPEKGLFYLNKLIKDLEEDCIGGIGECWNSEGKLKGCGMQLWGHAFVLKAIDEFLLGIKLNAFEKTVFLQPKLPEKINYIKRKIKLENTFFELIIERKKGKISAKTTNKKIKIEFY